MFFWGYNIGIKMKLCFRSSIRCFLTRNQHTCKFLLSYSLRALLNVLHENCVKLHNKKNLRLILTYKLIKFRSRKIAHTKRILKSFPNFLSTLNHASISFAFHEGLLPNLLWVSYSDFTIFRILTQKWAFRHISQLKIRLKICSSWSA